MTVVFITGASSGIGAGLVGRFLSDGAQVYALARREDLLAELADRWSQHRGAFRYQVADVRNREALSAAVKDCQAQFGPIDILIANAGVSESSPAHLFSSQLYQDSFQTNFFGALYAFEAVLPAMLERGVGHLVGMGSLAGYRGLPEAGAYCASKSALLTAMESMRMDLRRFGITVSVITPGFIKSPMTDQNLYHMPFLQSEAKGVDKIYRAILAKRSILSFPFPLSTAAWWGRVFPVCVYDWVMAGRRNVKKTR